MSEYIKIETEMSEEGSRIYFYTNLTLTEEGVETYGSVEAMEEGSPVAQMLAVIAGIASLRIEAREIAITRQPEVPWHAIVADVSAALKDFFL